MTTLISRNLLKKNFALSGIVRQTVLDGGVDSDGLANFLSAGAGLSVDVSATSKAIQLAFADGFDGGGAKDLIAEIIADTNIGSLPVNAKNYLYADRDPNTGAITYGHAQNLPPIYGTTYQKADGAVKAYSSFDGSDGATTFTDANGNAWIFNDNAQLDTTQKKFGTASLLLDGAGDYLKDSNLVLHAGENEGGFEIICWFRLNTTGTLQSILAGGSSNHIYLAIDTSENLVFYLGDGSSWTIADIQTGSTTLSTDTWYRVRIMWDGVTYKVYLSNNGAEETEEISVSSSIAFATEPDGYIIGAIDYLNYYFDGWIDDFSYSVGPQTVGIETPNANPRGLLAADEEHWFDLNSFKMNMWDQSTQAWIEKQRVFLGEAVTDGSSVTDIITYALKGQYESEIFDVSANTVYAKSHNIGMEPSHVDFYVRENNSFKWMKNYFNSKDSNAIRMGGNIVSNKLFTKIGFDDYIGTGFAGGQAFINQECFSTSNITTGQCKIKASRGW